MSPFIDILLSTHNGEQYLADQINSIVNQSFSNWRLIVRDDASSDNTLAIVHRYQQEFPEKITILSDSQGRLGPAASFSTLMQNSTAPYIALCDQDDVWFVDKLEKQYALIYQAEQENPVDHPLLVHSDLIVVNRNLSVLSPSFWEYQHLSPKDMASFQSLLVQNYVTGCSCLFNRALLRHSLPVPVDAIMHDWWLALIAMSQGGIINMHEATLMYRQHGANDTGAIKWGMEYNVSVLRKRPALLRQTLLATAKQSKALLSVNGLSAQSIECAEKYCQLFEKGWFRRRFELMRYGFWKFGLPRNLAMMLYL